MITKIYQEKILFEQNGIKYKVVKYNGSKYYNVVFLYKDITLISSGVKEGSFEKEEILQFNTQFIRIASNLAKLANDGFNFEPIGDKGFNLVDPNGKNVMTIASYDIGMTRYADKMYAKLGKINSSLQNKIDEIIPIETKEKAETDIDFFNHLEEISSQIVVS